MWGREGHERRVPELPVGHSKRRILAPQNDTPGRPPRMPEIILEMPFENARGHSLLSARECPLSVSKPFSRRKTRMPLELMATLMWPSTQDAFFFRQK